MEAIEDIDEPYCARCGSSVYWTDCDDCGADGFVEADYGDDVVPEMHSVPCGTCKGDGGWWFCLSPAEWCKSNPAHGCEQVPRGKIAGVR